MSQFRFLRSQISNLYHWYDYIRHQCSPQVNLVWGFFLYSLTGFLLLLIPFFHDQTAPVLDHLFIAVSAISTTGLATIDIAETYNFFGEFVLMCLFQIGGVGYMTLTTYFLLFTTEHISSWHKRVIGAEFTMPNTIRIRDFLRSVVYFTIIMEILGAIAFFQVFKNKFELWDALWFSIFHSVSSFCTAGVSLFPGSFEPYAQNPVINSTVSILAICGSLGFIVVTDLWYRLTGKTHKISFTTKIIFYGFIFLLGFGTLMIFGLEPISSSAWNLAFFQTMSAMTTVGFSTIPMSEISRPMTIFLIFIMYIGASPSGTAGGIKITTLTALLAILKSRLRGEREVTFLGRRVPYERLFVATSTFMMYTSIFFVATFFLSISEPEIDFDKIQFEAASALGTVGLSTGVTALLSTWGKVTLIILMFVGRVGVLTFGFALLSKNNTKKKELVNEDLAV